MRPDVAEKARATELLASTKVQWKPSIVVHRPTDKPVKTRVRKNLKFQHKNHAGKRYHRCEIGGIRSSCWNSTEEERVFGWGLVLEKTVTVPAGQSVKASVQ